MVAMAVAVAVVMIVRWWWSTSKGQRAVREWMWASSKWASRTSRATEWVRELALSVVVVTVTAFSLEIGDVIPERTRLVVVVQHRWRRHSDRSNR